MDHTPPGLVVWVRGWTHLTVNNLDSDERAGRRNSAHTGRRPLWAPEDRDRWGGGAFEAGQQAEETEEKRMDVRPPTREME